MDRSLHTAPDWRGHVDSCEDGVGDVVVGKRTIIRELVIINRGSHGNCTIIGDDCYLMSQCFVGHDSKIGNGVTLSPGCKVAGFVTIGDWSTLGMNSSIHQHARFGKCCMLGANSFFKGDTPDGIVWCGVPSVPIKVNTVGIERAGISDDEKKLMTENAELFIDFFKGVGNI